MAKSVKNIKKEFNTRLQVYGDNAEIIRKGLEDKMAKENRKTFTNTIEDILVNHFNKKTKD